MKIFINNVMKHKNKQKKKYKNNMKFRMLKIEKIKNNTSE